MPKTYTCRDVGVDCDWKASAETEDEIMATVSKHAAEAHPTIELTRSWWRQCVKRSKRGKATAIGNARLRASHRIDTC